MGLTACTTSMCHIYLIVDIKGLDLLYAAHVIAAKHFRISAGFMMSLSFAPNANAQGELSVFYCCY